MRLDASLKNLATVLAGFTLVSCQEAKWLADRLLAKDAEWESVEWTVLAHRQADEQQGRPMMFWVAQDADETHPLTPELAGFEPSWGIEYRVEVKFRETRSGPFGDVAGMPWRSFERIISETSRAGSEFTVPSIGAAWLREDRRAFIDGQAFTCSEEATCAKLDELASQPETRVDMMMRHGERPGLVELLGVEPAAPE